MSKRNLRSNRIVTFDTTLELIQATTSVCRRDFSTTRLFNSIFRIASEIDRYTHQKRSVASLHDLKMKYHSVVFAGQLLCTLAATLLAPSSVDAFAINPSLAKRLTSGVSLWAKGKVKLYEIQDLPEDFGDVTGAFPFPTEEETTEKLVAYLFNSANKKVEFRLQDGKASEVQHSTNVSSNNVTLLMPRNQLFVIKDMKISESNIFKTRSDSEGAGEVNLTEKFPEYPFEKVDAAFSDGTRVYFFNDAEYAEYSVYKNVNLRARNITFIGRNDIIDEESPFKDIPISKGEKIGPVITHPKSAFAVFFKGREYFKYNTIFRKFDEGQKIKLENFRFNKCPPIDPAFSAEQGSFDTGLYPKGVHKDVFPLNPDDYEDGFEGKAKHLKGETLADSVVLSDDIKLEAELDNRNYQDKNIAEIFEKDPITGATIKPVYPGNGEDDFWKKQFGAVVEAQTLRQLEGKVTKGGDDEASKLNVWPDLWYDRSTSTLNPFNEDRPESGLTLELVAKSVAGEFSNYHQQTLLKSFSSQLVESKADLDNPTKIKLASDIGGSKGSFNNFIGQEVRMGAINAWSLEAVAPINFFLKWNYGVPRPEEVAWNIHCGVYDDNDGVPSDLIKAIKAMKLENAADFTAYENGSPTHPSFPAMHSAGSTCSLWIPTLYDISDEQYLQTLRMDYAVAYARTVAGVHYPQDNLAGLNAGQRIIREKLPKFLSEQYGYDEEKVKEKVKYLSFDWDKVKFTKDDCMIQVGTKKPMSYKDFRERGKSN